MSGSRIVERSKKYIKDALLEIMYEKEFSHITVNELLLKAGVSRGTFYAHFSNLEDVRRQLIDDLFVYADSLCCDYKPSELAHDPYPVLLQMAQIITTSKGPAERIFKFINAYDMVPTSKHGLQSTYSRMRHLSQALAETNVREYMPVLYPAA